MRMMTPIQKKQLQFPFLCILVFGGLAYLVRAANLITPLGGVFTLDLRDFFVTIGAAIGGPFVGLIIGIIAGLPARIPILDVLSFATAGTVVGLLTRYLDRKGWNIAFAGVGILAGYGVALVLSIALQLTDSIVFLGVRAAICTPLNILILNNLYTAFPRLRDYAKGIF